ncbi:phage tail protein [Hoeflea phototrophica]|uniref:phage tail protein n=1 Tax=Hoeflea phototrophica TaxID=244596 RepID=UPI0002EE02F4|nr:phage tail protein [Hoeflea phototrophica]
MSVELGIDARDFRVLGAAIHRLPAELKAKAFRSAVNHTGKKARTQVARLAAKYSGLPYRFTRDAAQMKLTGDDVEIRLRSKWISLAALGAVKSPRGVRVRGRGSYAGAFIATSKISGGRAVLIRKGKSRTPVRELYGANPAHAMGEDRHGEFERLAQSLMDRDFADRLLHEINRLIPRSAR